MDNIEKMSLQQKIKSLLVSAIGEEEAQIRLKDLIVGINNEDWTDENITDWSIQNLAPYYDFEHLKQLLLGESRSGLPTN